MAGVAGRSGGRNARTVEEHELRGTKREDRHGSYDNPNPPRIKPESPKELTGDAQAEWDLMMGRLEVSGILTLVDDAVLYQYCKLYAETEAIARQQEEIQGSLDIVHENMPDVKEMSAPDRLALFSHIANLEKLVSKCTDQLRQGRMALRTYLIEFGMTPAARSRVKIAKKDETKSKWDGAL